MLHQTPNWKEITFFVSESDLQIKRHENGDAVMSPDDLNENYRSSVFTTDISGFKRYRKTDINVLNHTFI